MTYIMGEEPLSGITPQELIGKFSGDLSERELATAFALSSNQFWWVEDNVYDYDEGTPEHKEAVRITGEWCHLMEYYEEKIFVILRGEGVQIPDTGRIAVLSPFMERNGYFDGDGWWIEIEEADGVSLLKEEDKRNQ